MIPINDHSHGTVRHGPHIRRAAPGAFDGTPDHSLAPNVLHPIIPKIL